MTHTTIVDELRAGRSVTCFTVGCSMRPLLVERMTHVVIYPLEKAKKGDILLYIREDGKQVLHRLIRQDAAHYYMRGDNTYGLEKLPKAQAVGVVRYIYRKGKQIDVAKNAAYRAYAALWHAMYPLRLTAWRARRLIRRVIK